MVYAELTNLEDWNFNSVAWHELYVTLQGLTGLKGVAGVAGVTGVPPARCCAFWLGGGEKSAARALFCGGGGGGWWWCARSLVCKIGARGSRALGRLCVAIFYLVLLCLGC